MITVKIGGLNREIVLLKSKVDYFVKKFNTYYAWKSKDLRKSETSTLVLIDQEPDQEKKLQMINEYVDRIEKHMEQIPFPYKMIYDIAWELLPESERKFFRNKLGFPSKKVMINTLRVDEIQPLADVIGMRVLNLSGYNKKKV